ncbi:MAG: hypothetical protein WD076_12075, partial [Parvularculaceae bacterium]
ALAFTSPQLFGNEWRLGSIPVAREPAAMSPASKARLRAGVTYANGKGACVAPAGEYAIERADKGAVRFTGGANASVFTLSIDAVYQHVFEGRIVFIDGRLLPADRTS